MKLIDVQGVSKVYPQGGAWERKKHVHALKDVSLSIDVGECLTVVGPSGSGKSTLGRLVLGLETPQAGRISYKGKAYSELKGEAWREARRNIQVVFQNSHGAVNPRFTAEEIVAEPLTYFTELKGSALSEQVAAALGKVGLNPECMGKLPHQFSGGELQRICIARALALSPELVVLDEAVSSLDVLNQSLVLDLLMKIRRETGMAFLFITHDLRIVGKLADSVAIIDKGRLVCYAKDLRQPDEMATLQQNPVFQTLAQAIFPSMPHP